MTIKLEEELKEMIVESLMLEDVSAENIDSEASLFDEGLGLDSIDALELAIAIERRFGVKIDANEEHAPQIFASVRSLAQYLEQRQPATN